MQTYLLSVLGASLAVALVGILTPNGSSRHMKLISSLFLICVLIAPLPKAFTALRDFGESLSPGESGGNDDYQTQLQEAVNSASRTYFAQTLTQLLQTQFSLTAGEVRCSIRWADDSNGMRPLHVTVILSGSAIWKDPAPMEQFVTDLLGCECTSAVE